ncbi:hypothetical protein OKW40_004078 [Paraburkholderia sp. RAU6.4a]
MKYGYFVFTSNVDGAFQKAGYDSDRIMECHGSMHFLQCIDACDGRTWSVDGFGPVIDLARCRLVSNIPACPRRGALAQPNMLLFDDHGWIDTPLALQRERFLVASRTRRRPPSSLQRVTAMFMPYMIDPQDVTAGAILNGHAPGRPQCCSLRRHYSWAKVSWGYPRSLGNSLPGMRNAPTSRLISGKSPCRARCARSFWAS